MLKQLSYITVSHAFSLASHIFVRVKSAWLALQLPNLDCEPRGLHFSQVLPSKTVTAGPICSFPQGRPELCFT